MNVGLLLAAGLSRRMGRDKLSLLLGGKTVLEWCLDTYLASALDVVLVVVGRADTIHRDDVRLKTSLNESREEGIASSIRAGVRARPMQTTALVIGLADMPAVRHGTIDALLHRFSAGDAGAVYPTYRGEQGNPVLWSKKFFAELGGLSGDRGGKALLEAHASEAVPVAVDDPGVRLDLDSEEDYARMRLLFEDTPDFKE